MRNGTESEAVSQLTKSGFFLTILKMLFFILFKLLPFVTRSFARRYLKIVSRVAGKEETRPDII